MTVDRKPMLASEVIAMLTGHIRQHGDNPVFFTDGFHRYGADVYSAPAANFDSSQAVLVRPFDLATGMSGPRAPLAM